MGNEKFAFRKLDKIGVADAEADRKILLECFVDTGDYEALADFSRPERFILGRTGAGKTALITRLKNENENVIVIEPESLALGYVSNSTILNTVSELGVDLDIFFRLLWRHVLGVEVLKRHFNITNENENFSFFETMTRRFTKNKNKHHLRALEYLKSWGSSFWRETDSRVKELTKNLESNIQGAIGVGNDQLGAKLASGQQLTQHEKIEVIQRSQEIVNQVQMKELTDLIKMLDDAIEDEQKKYFLVIDKLDEKWVEDKLRYRLIKALIETVKDFNVVEQVKPLVVLRVDLINRVYDLTRDSGFQEEKFATLHLPVSWTKNQLVELLDKRINYLVQQRYTNQKVTHRDLLPESINGQKSIEYMINRTYMRPRDLIQFFNLCIQEATNSPIINAEMLIGAEREYSRDRFEALTDEWYADYPHVKDLVRLLGNESQLFVEDISLKSVEDLSLEYIDRREEVSVHGNTDKIYSTVSSYLEDHLSLIELRSEIIKIMYIIGILGVQLQDQRAPLWSYEQKRSLRVEELTPDTILYIHPCLWSCLNIKSQGAVSTDS